MSDMLLPPICCLLLHLGSGSGSCSSSGIVRLLWLAFHQYGIYAFDELGFELLEDC